MSRSGGAQTKEFALGAFVDDFTYNNLSMSQDVMPELLLGEIRKALITWP